jgi:hypothetical protein
MEIQHPKLRVVPPRTLPTGPVKPRRKNNLWKIDFLKRFEQTGDAQVPINDCAQQLLAINALEWDKSWKIYLPMQFCLAIQWNHLLIGHTVFDITD